MRILFTGNCQCDGLVVFMQRALPQFEFRSLPHLASHYKEFSEEKIAEDHAWADLVFFHHKHDHPQDYPTKQPKIPLSVWFQSGPFAAQSEDCYWLPVVEHARHYGVDSACDFAARDADLGYEQRWASCFERMKEKEENENVPKEIRVSDLMENYGRTEQQQLTCNHPTSVIFADWTFRILRYLDLVGFIPTMDELRANPNLAGLPCEESATSGARRHLSLKWGGRPEDDDSGRQIARERLSRLMI
jgi:hypothetical protein